MMSTLSDDGEYADREFVTACESRLKSKCEHCARIYRGDSFALLRDGVKDLQEDEHVYFVTVTAPGGDLFGATHGLRRNHPCPCGRKHSKKDPTLGTPVDPETYRYDLAAGFNASACRLFTLGIQRLRRWAKRQGGNVRYIRVAEWQRRGLIHIHAIIVTTASAEQITTAYQGGSAEPGVHRRCGPVGHAGFSWGTRMDVQEVAREKGMGKIGVYMAKLVGYVTKTTPESGLHEGNEVNGEKMRAAALKRTECKHLSSACAEGRRWTQLRPGTKTTPEGSVRRSGTTQRRCRRHQRAWEQAGFTGHVFGRARNWGTKTRALLKAIRAEHTRAALAQRIAEHQGDGAAQAWLDAIDNPDYVIISVQVVPAHSRLVAA